MLPSNTLFESQMDYLLFLYGFSFMVLAGICITLPKNSEQRLPWLWLGLYGIVQGIHEWLHMVSFSQGVSEIYITVCRFIFALSFLFLFEFAREGYRLVTNKGPERWIYIPLLTITMIICIVNGIATETMIFFTVGLLSGLWASLTLWMAAKKASQSKGPLKMAAFILVLFTFFSCLFSPPDPFLPTTVLNFNWFFRTTGSKVELVNALLIVLLSICLLKNKQKLQEEAFFFTFEQRPVFSVHFAWLTVLILCGGWFFTEKAGQSTDAQIRHFILQQSELSAAAIEIDKIQGLEGSPKDENAPNFHRLQALLDKMNRPVEDVRSVYLLFLRDGKIYFSADSLDPADLLFSKPGEVFNAPPKELLKTFSSGTAVVVGPYMDEMGAYISGYAAIQDPVSKKTLAVLGLDMEQSRWARKVAESRQRTIEVTLLLVMFLLGFFVSRRRLLDTAAHLSSNERRMVEAQRIAHVGSWDWITRKDRLFWSEETSRIFGDSTGVTLLKISHFYDRVHPEDRPRVQTLLQQAIKSLAPFSFEHRILLPDGTERYVLERGHTLFDADGKAVRVMGSTQDITEHKAMENAQQASEARFRALIENAPPPIIIIRKVRILYSNPSFLRVFGYEKAEDICNHSLGELFAPECREMICNRSLRREQGSPEPNDYETTAQRQDGTPFFVQITVTRIELPDGPAGVAFFQDITARKKAELELQRYQESLEARVRERTKELTEANQALREEVIERWRAEELLRRSEERMRLFFERQLVGMAITSPKREWLQVNEKLCDLLGYSQQELLHLTWSGLTHPDDVEQNLQVFNDLAEGKSEGFTMEKRFIRKDGSVLYANMAVGCVRNPDRTLDYVLLLIEDITARKMAENELKKLLSELGRSNKELEQFAYVASHDLQEPLRLVSAYTQLLMQRYRDKLDQNAEPIVKFITEGVSRMQQLILDLLAYSRVSSRSKPFCVENAEKILETAEHNLAISLRETKAVITHDPLPNLLCEPTQFGQLLQNLIGNAIKFRGKEPPRIHVGASKDSANMEWHFTVSDNGIGIEPEFHERIFIIFQRLHSRTKYSGTGIGLAICKRVVERHNGRIWVESQPGNGATFHFTIPINLKQHDTNIIDTCF